MGRVSECNAKLGGGFDTVGFVESADGLEVEFLAAHTDLFHKEGFCFAQVQEILNGAPVFFGEIAVK